MFSFICKDIYVPIFLPDLDSFHFVFFIGSEIYQETLAKALAKYFGVGLLIVDTIALPGVRFYHS